MEIFETTTGEEGQIITGELATLFRVLSKPDTLKILYRTGIGIENSKYAIEELGLTPKRYYSRLRELIDTGLVRKMDGVYRQTALGRLVYERFLPTMGKAFDSREELELIVYLEGTELENGVRKRIEEELGIPSFAEPTKLRIIDNYESMVIDVIDICDEAKESILIASNYLDVRVMEATLRAMDRDVTNKVIMGKRKISSKLQNLRMMLSLTFAKTLINFASNEMNLKEFVRFIDLPYTFCVMDGHHSIIEVSNTSNESFIVAISIDNRDVGEKLTKFFEMLWNTGEFDDALNFVNSIDNELNGEASQQYSEL